MKPQFNFFSPITWIIVFVNVSVFAFANFVYGNDIIWQLGLTPYFLNVYGITDPYYHPWITLLTHSFVQVDWQHLFWNMLLLWLTGSAVEKTIGSGRFAVIYFLGGLIAAGTYLFFAKKFETEPMIGASGCVSAIIGAYVIVFAFNFKRLLTIYNIALMAFILKWIADQISGIAGFAVIPGVGYWAHVGGFLFGAAILSILTVSRRRNNVKEAVL